MSTRRFPRSRIVRDLIRLENELDTWISTFNLELSATNMTSRREAYLSERLGELEHLQHLVHVAADFAGWMPPRFRELVSDPHTDRGAIREPAVAWVS